MNKKIRFKRPTKHWYNDKDKRIILDSMPLNHHDAEYIGRDLSTFDKLYDGKAAVDMSDCISGNVRFMPFYRRIALASNVHIESKLANIDHIIHNSVIGIMLDDLRTLYTEARTTKLEDVISFFGEHGNTYVSNLVAQNSLICSRLIIPNEDSKRIQILSDRIIQITNRHVPIAFDIDAVFDDIASLSDEDKNLFSVFYYAKQRNAPYNLYCMVNNATKLYNHILMISTSIRDKVVTSQEIADNMRLSVMALTAILESVLDIRSTTYVYGYEIKF